MKYQRHLDPGVKFYLVTELKLSPVQVGGPGANALCLVKKGDVNWKSQSECFILF